MTAAEVVAFERAVGAGGVAVFPADTVYGLACDPGRAEAVGRMYELKGRRPDKPSALMFFDLDVALETVACPEPTRAALTRLLPGAVTVVLPGGTGLRVPALEGRLEPLRALRRPVLQTSANRAGGRDPRHLDEVPAEIRDAAEVVLDAGPLPGTPSTVVDLREFADTGGWRVLREGAVPARALEEALSSGGR